MNMRRVIWCNLCFFPPRVHSMHAAVVVGHFFFSFIPFQLTIKICMLWNRFIGELFFFSNSVGGGRIYESLLQAIYLRVFCASEWNVLFNDCLFFFLLIIITILDLFFPPNRKQLAFEWNNLRSRNETVPCDRSRTGAKYVRNNANSVSYLTVFCSAVTLCIVILMTNMV